MTSPLPRPSRLGRAALCVALLSFASLASCAGAPPASSSDDARALASADVRLRGGWRLAHFTPETPLEPTLNALLEFQYGTLAIRFAAGRVVAESPGIHVDRAYKISEAYGDRFKLVSFDDQGVPYESLCDFVGDDGLEIHSETPPWRGVAMLHKAAP